MVMPASATAMKFNSETLYYILFLYYRNYKLFLTGQFIIALGCVGLFLFNSASKYGSVCCVFYLLFSLDLQCSSLLFLMYILSVLLHFSHCKSFIFALVLLACKAHWISLLVVEKRDQFQQENISSESDL